MRIVREWIVVSGQGAVQAARRADGEHRPLQMGFRGVAKYNVQSARFLRGGMRASISGLRAAYPKRACGRSALRIFCKLAMRPKTFCRERS